MNSDFIVRPKKILLSKFLFSILFVGMTGCFLFNNSDSDDICGSIYGYADVYYGEVSRAQCESSDFGVWDDFFDDRPARCWCANSGAKESMGLAFLDLVCDDDTGTDPQNICNFDRIGTGGSTPGGRAGERFIVAGGSFFNVVLRGRGYEKPVTEVAVDMWRLNFEGFRVPIAGGAGVASFPRLEINDIYVPLEDFFIFDTYIFRLFEFDQSDAISPLEVTSFDLNVRIADTNQPAGYDLSTIVHSADPEETIEVETGEDFFIDIWITNHSNEPVHDVEVFTLVPDGFLWPPTESEPSHGSYSGASGFWDIGTLPAETEAKLRIHTIAETPGEFTWEAEIIKGLEGDTNPDNNRDQARIIVIQHDDDAYDLSIIVHSDDPDEIIETEHDEPFFIDIWVTNHSSQTVQGVQAETHVPEGFRYPPGAEPLRGTYNAENGIWDIGDLPAETEALMRIHTFADTPGDFVWIAEITTGLEGDTNPENNRDEARISVIDEDTD